MAQQDTSRKSDTQSTQKPVSAASAYGVVEFINQSYTVASADQSRLMHMQGVYV